MSGPALAGIIAGIIVVLIALVRASSPQQQAKAARYCTKHVLRQSMIPGGPEQLVWVYGPHRTKGNACDGPEHRRRTGWW